MWRSGDIWQVAGLGVSELQTRWWLVLRWLVIPGGRRRGEGRVLEMQSMEGIEGDPAQQWSSGGYGNHKSEEELQDEEQDDKTILQVALRPPPYSSALKINFPDLCRKFR